MYLVLAFVAFVLFATSALIVLDCARRQPMGHVHAAQLARKQGNFTVLMVAAALALGLALDNLL